MDGHLTKARGGKKGQIRPMIRFRFLFFGGTGDNRTRQFQRSICISSNPFWPINKIQQFGNHKPVSGQV